VGESEENLGLMRLLDEQYTRTPCYGVLKMEAYLRSLGHEVNTKRVRRLLRKMGLEANVIKLSNNPLIYFALL
jgi:putative transposase